MRWAVVAAALLIVVAAAFLVRVPKEEPVETVPISEWRAPTDFLLRTPGSELLMELPRIEAEVPVLKGDRS
jgi:hypothetical protein